MLARQILDLNLMEYDPKYDDTPIFGIAILQNIKS
jgi:hypothetical protein